VLAAPLVEANLPVTADQLIDRLEGRPAAVMVRRRLRERG
jgi:hypothetical protein